MPLKPQGLSLLPVMLCVALAEVSAKMVLTIADRLPLVAIIF